MIELLKKKIRRSMQNDIVDNFDEISKKSNYSNETNFEAQFLNSIDWWIIHIVAVFNDTGKKRQRVVTYFYIYTIVYIIIHMFPCTFHKCSTYILVMQCVFFMYLRCCASATDRLHTVLSHCRTAAAQLLRLLLSAAILLRWPPLQVLLPIAVVVARHAVSRSNAARCLSLLYYTL